MYECRKLHQSVPEMTPCNRSISRISARWLLLVGTCVVSSDPGTAISCRSANSDSILLAVFIVLEPHDMSLAFKSPIITAGGPVRRLSISVVMNRVPEGRHVA